MRLASAAITAALRPASWPARCRAAPTQPQTDRPDDEGDEEDRERVVHEPDGATVDALRGVVLVRVELQPTAEIALGVPSDVVRVRSNVANRVATQRAVDVGF